MSQEKTQYCFEDATFGGYLQCSTAEVQMVKEPLLEQMYDALKNLSERDDFWIVKPACTFDENNPLAEGEPIDGKVTVAWKFHLPQMDPRKDYKQLMVQEYWQLKDRYNKLHATVIKYEAGTLDFTPTCSLELLKVQKATLWRYLYVLEIRMQSEGIDLYNRKIL